MKAHPSKYKLPIAFLAVLGLSVAFLLIGGFLGGFSNSNLFESTINSRQNSSPSKLPTGESVAPTVNPAIGITLEEDQRIGPFPPANSSMSVSSDGSVNLEWFDTGSEIVTSFNIYRRNGNGDWELLQNVEVRPKQDKYLYLDKSFVSNEGLQYAITAVDAYGNESNILDSEILILYDHK